MKLLYSTEWYFPCRVSEFRYGQTVVWSFVSLLKCHGCRQFPALFLRQLKAGTKTKNLNYIPVAVVTESIVWQLIRELLKLSPHHLSWTMGLIFQGLKSPDSHRYIICETTCAYPPAFSHSEDSQWSTDLFALLSKVWIKEKSSLACGQNAKGT